METRKQVEERLKGNEDVNQEKRLHEDKMADTFSKLFGILDTKISDLRATKVEIKDNYTFQMTSLQETLKVHHEAIFECKIPTEVKVINETKISLNDKTRLFLILSFFFCLFISIGSVWYSNYRIAEADKNAQILIDDNIKNSIPLKDQKWFIKFYQYQSNANPKDTKKFIKEFGEVGK